mgnify:CR=1 FL=1
MGGEVAQGAAAAGGIGAPAVGRGAGEKALECHRSSDTPGAEGGGDIEVGGQEPVVVPDGNGTVLGLGEPGEVASILAWLASEEGGFATGADFSVNGGLHMG